MLIDTTGVSSVGACAVNAESEDLSAGLGRAICELRNKKRFSQMELAMAIGLERTSITNIEAGKQKLSVLHLMRIADALGVEVQITFRDKAASGKEQVE